MARPRRPMTPMAGSLAARRRPESIRRSMTRAAEMSGGSRRARSAKLLRCARAICSASRPSSTRIRTAWNSETVPNIARVNFIHREQLSERYPCTAVTLATHARNVAVVNFGDSHDPRPREGLAPTLRPRAVVCFGLAAPRGRIIARACVESDFATSHFLRPFQGC